jgi:hypothetical protein
MKTSKPHDPTQYMGKIPMLAERLAVAAVENFHDIGTREHEALKENYAKQEAIRDELGERHRREMDAALAALRDEEERLREPFRKEHEALEGYPNSGEGWSMFDDWTGVYCCTISGLPLREDDDIVPHGHGDALAALACEETA